MDYITRRIDKSQLINLIKLYESVYHKNSVGLTGLVERFNTEIFGESYIGYIAYNKNKVYKDGVELPAAYYGVFPQIAIQNNIKIFCAQSGDTMTHIDHRGKGLFVMLAKLTYELAKERGVKFIYGFPGVMSYPGFKNKLKWEFPYKMLGFVCYIPTIPYGIIKKKLRYEIGTLNSMDNFSYYLNIANKSILKDFQIENDCSKLSILRNEDYISYKTQLINNKWLLEYNGTSMLIKYDGDINIGDITGNYSNNNLKHLFSKLKIISFLTGSIRIRTFFSPNSKFKELIAPYGKISEAMPYGFLSLDDCCNPAELELKYIDFDYF